VDTAVLLAILLLIHVAGAIIGFGPTFTFAILGPMAGKAGPHGGLALLEGMEAIEKKLVVPVAMFVQPLSGLTLIFLAGYNVNFFSHYWLWVGIVLYAIAFYLAIFGQNKRLPRRIELAQRADIHLQMLPGTDVVLLNAMVNHIFAKKLEDTKFIEGRTHGIDELRESVVPYTPEMAETITGVPAALIRARMR